MNLKNMTPKDKQLYEISAEAGSSFICALRRRNIPEDFEDIIYMIRRAEYKRGKGDGHSESLNTLRVEVFKIIKWSKDHGNNDELISKKQVAKIIDSLLEPQVNNTQQCLKGEKPIEGRDHSGQLQPSRTNETPDKDSIDNTRTIPAETRKGGVGIIDVKFDTSNHDKTKKDLKTLIEGLDGLEGYEDLRNDCIEEVRKLNTQEPLK